MLTPGVFWRLGDGSSVKMVSASLFDTEVDIDPGGATVDVAEVHKEGDLRIVEDGNRHRVNKDGIT